MMRTLLCLSAVLLPACAWALGPEVRLGVEKALLGADFPVPSLGAASEPKAPAVRDAQSERRTAKFSIELSGVCDGRHLAVPGWCPKPGQGVRGGLYREIEVRRGDAVEIELTLNMVWFMGRHSFVIVPDGEIDRENLKPAYGEIVSFAGPDKRTLRFTADKAGTFQYFDPFVPSGVGRLIVKP